MVRLLQITDIHLLAERNQTLLVVNTEKSFTAVLEMVMKESQTTNLALVTGDLVQDARLPSYHRLKQRLHDLSFPCYCLPGNHDDPDLMRMTLLGQNIHYQSHVLIDQWQIICLDSTIPGHPGGRLAQDQLDLLDSLLKEHPDHFAFIALHHHPVPSGSAWMDTMLIENADQFFAVIKKYAQVRVIICGHVHQEMDVVQGSLRIISAPSTCFQFKPQQSSFALDEIPPGYRWIELYPNGSLKTGVQRLAEMPLGIDLNSHGY